MHNHNHPKFVFNIENLKIFGGDLQAPYFFKEDSTALILNLTGLPHKQNLSSYFDDCQVLKFDEIVLNVEDGSVPFLNHKFYTKILTYGDFKYEKLLVHCEAGHGRTGTILCALRMVHFSETPKQALEFVRSVFCKDAVETELQISYLKWLWEDLGNPEFEECLFGSDQLNFEFDLF